MLWEEFALRCSTGWLSMGSVSVAYRSQTAKQSVVSNLISAGMSEKETFLCYPGIFWMCVCLTLWPVLPFQCFDTIGWKDRPFWPVKVLFSNLQRFSFGGFWGIQLTWTIQQKNKVKSPNGYFCYFFSFLLDGSGSVETQYHWKRLTGKIQSP